jgi:hypothetical protein
MHEHVTLHSPLYSVGPMIDTEYSCVVIHSDRNQAVAMHPLYLSVFTVNISGEKKEPADVQSG